MNPLAAEQAVSHVVAMPYPGRGHINPMMNLCHLLASKSNNTLFITFVVTEEWLGFIGSETKPAIIRFATLPNVLPSELVRSADIEGFVTAVQTKMEEPFEQLLDRLEPPVKLIIADTFLPWAVHVGNRRSIAVASFFPMSGSLFSIFYHSDLLLQNQHQQHFPLQLSGRENDCVSIPGLSPMHLADLPNIFFKQDNRLLHRALHPISLVPKAQYLFFPSIYELEFQAIDVLKQKLPLPIYTFGPTIPYFKLKDNPSTTTNSNDLSYLKWLDSKPPRTVLYISLGSFLSVSSAQMDEIAAGLRESGVRYLWVARGETHRLNEARGSEGLVVPWCDQLRVLCHSSIGGFWTHCGWSSTMESVFAGVPMITFPILMDQIPNSKFVVEDWKNGWKVKEKSGVESVVRREEIAELVRRFMDLENRERKEMMRRAKELQEICQQAIVDGGSSDANIHAFIREISRCCEH